MNAKNKLHMTILLLLFLNQIFVLNDSNQAETTHFESARSNVIAAAQPHLLDQVGVRLCDFAPHAQRILPVDLGLVLVVEEVLSERRCIAQALGKQRNKLKLSILTTCLFRC